MHKTKCTELLLRDGRNSLEHCSSQRPCNVYVYSIYVYSIYACSIYACNVYVYSIYAYSIYVYVSVYTHALVCIVYSL